MVVDSLRSCYKTKCRFFKDSDIESTIVYYFCRPGAPALPFTTRFASGVWAYEKGGWPGPGEVQGATREYYNGKPPQDADRFSFCGTAEQFREGALIEDADQGPAGLDFLPVCHPGTKGNLILQNPFMARAWRRYRVILIPNTGMPCIHPSFTGDHVIEWDGDPINPAWYVVEGAFTLGMASGFGPGSGQMGVFNSMFSNTDFRGAVNMCGSSLLGSFDVGMLVSIPPLSTCTNPAAFILAKVTPVVE
jgi:hypothetical protein